MGRVIHIKEAPDYFWELPGYQYIGRRHLFTRPGSSTVLATLDSPFGNRFRIGPDGDRAEVIRKHKVSLPDDIKRNPFLGWQIMHLHSATLVCFCKPEACHGDTLLDTAQRLHLLWAEERANWIIEALDNPISKITLDRHGLTLNGIEYRMWCRYMGYDPNL